MARKDNKRYAEARKAWVKQKADKYLEFLEENVRKDPEVSWAYFVGKARMQKLNQKGSDRQE